MAADVRDTRAAWRSWTTLTPVTAMVLLVVTWGQNPNAALASVVFAVLVGAVLAAVHHAEVVAHRVGEPFGSLVLAVAVTVIEVALIVTLMVSGEKDTSALARDTVFAAVMISVNGIVGLSLLVGAIKGAGRSGLAVFNAEGTGSSLATVVTLATLTLVLPRFTTTEPGPEFSAGQLAFAAVASLLVYLMFVFTQTVQHRDFFLPVESGERHGAPRRGRRRPRRPAVQPHRPDQRRPAGRGAGECGRAGQGRVARDRGRRRRRSGSRTPSSVS